jgi:hypothetical protein
MRKLLSSVLSQMNKGQREAYEASLQAMLRTEDGATFIELLERAVLLPTESGDDRALREWVGARFLAAEIRGFADDRRNDDRARGRARKIARR